MRDLQQLLQRSNAGIQKEFDNEVEGEKEELGPRSNTAIVIQGLGNILKKVSAMQEIESLT